MPNRPGHRRFGTIRRLASGRYQVRYRGVDGRLRPAPDTYPTRRDAERVLTLIESAMIRGEWIEPERGKVTTHDYADAWITQRPGLRPRTVDLYRWLLAKHIDPYLGRFPIGKLTTEIIREWRVALLDSGVSESMTAKAYRLLRAVLMTAADDRLIPRSPCRIRGAGDEKPAERPILTIDQVLQLADEMRDRRFRALVLLATFASLRWGEAIALRRADIDADRCIVRVRAAYVERSTGPLTLGPPKSRAGRRTIRYPTAIAGDIRHHLDTYTGPDPHDLVFSGAKGRPLRRSNFRRSVGWREAAQSVGVGGLHFHDLRHTGNTLAAQTGASLADLMARMGHDSPRAAMIYQHDTDEASQAIADALTERVNSHRDTPNHEDQEAGLDDASDDHVAAN